MGHMDRLPLDRHLAEQARTELARVGSEIEATRRVSLEEEINLRFTPTEETFRQVMDRQLTPQQLSVIDLLVEGASDREVARTFGISRTTVARWRQFHPAFVAELNRRRDSTLDAAADRLRRVTRHAVDVLEQYLDDTNRPELRLRAAIGLLRMLGIGTRASRVGAISADDIIDDAARAKRKHTLGMVDHGEREDVLIDLARRDEGARVDDNA